MVSVVLDVGANQCQYVQDIRSKGYSGRVISFEPLRDAFEQQQTVVARESNWEAVNCGVGASAGTMEIHVAGNSQSSSFLPMLPRHIAAAPTTGYVAAQAIDVISLDSLVGQKIKNNDVVWLKLDVQGYELTVLEGASRLLNQTVAVEAELSLVPLYEGGPLLDEVIRYLAGKAFRLSYLLETDRFIDPRTNQLLQVNGIFLKEKTTTDGCRYER